MSKTYPDNWAFRQVDGEWVIYEIEEHWEYSSEEYLARELGRGQAWGQAVRQAEIAIADAEAKAERDRVAQQFELQLFGPKPEDILVKMLRRDLSRGAREGIRLAAAYAAQQQQAMYHQSPYGSGYNWPYGR